VRRGLKVHPAKGGSFQVERNVALNPPSIQPINLKFSFAPGSGKKTALVLKPFRLYDESPSECGFRKNHG
jgi:hypothetical protein